MWWWSGSCGSCLVLCRFWDGARSLSSCYGGNILILFTHGRRSILGSNPRSHGCGGSGVDLAMRSCGNCLVSCRFSDGARTLSCGGGGVCGGGGGCGSLAGALRQDHVRRRTLFEGTRSACGD